MVATVGRFNYFSIAEGLNTMQNDNYDDDMIEDYYAIEERRDFYDELMELEAEKASEFHKMAEQDFEDDYGEFYGL
jgi:hypothetical protein